MATRRSTASQKPSSRQSGLPLPSLRLPSPLRREVFGVMSIVIGLLSVIALLSPSGTVSGWWNGLLVDLFGWMAPLPALAFIALGIQLIRDGITQERYVRWETLTALAVLVLAYHGLCAVGSRSAGDGRSVSCRRRDRLANPRAAHDRTGVCGSSDRPLCHDAYNNSSHVFNLAGTYP